MTSLVLHLSACMTGTLAMEKDQSASVSGSEVTGDGSSPGFDWRWGDKDQQLLPELEAGRISWRYTATQRDTDKKRCESVNVEVQHWKTLL